MYHKVQSDKLIIVEFNLEAAQVNKNLLVI